MVRPYKPIAEYAAIGNLRTVALVGRDGSIDWCPFPHLGSPSVFAAILDARRGGRFAIAPPEGGPGEQRYVPDTNVLETRFRTGQGSLTITDFMPLAGSLRGTDSSSAAPEIHRILACSGGNLEVEVEWSPRFDYGRIAPRIDRSGRGWVAAGGHGLMALGGVDEADVAETMSGPVLAARLDLADGDRKALVARWDSHDTSSDCTSSDAELERTIRIWRDWVHREGTLHSEEWAGDWLPFLIRSELALKLLTYADTGAIAAAATTSLPERIGGVRNWDYRYSWIRDASQTAQAFVALGHREEAIEFLEWIEDVADQDYLAGKAPQIMYGVHGEADLVERTLDHLEGYNCSRPVRIGNAAAAQNQHEVFGELLLTGYELLRRGVPLDMEVMDLLGWAADHVCTVWRNPDHGIWEVRGPPRHYVHSKVMCWVALDYAVHIAEGFGLAGDVDAWRRNRDELRTDILDHGYDAELRSFVMAYGSRDLDAANLRIPIFAFLSFDDERVQGTIDATMEHLMENGLVQRYNAQDNLPGREGAFALCTFWLVDALALSDRHDEAVRIFEGMLGRANHAGLFAEQIDPVSGAFLGNFPQAFTHIGLINSALYLAYAEGKPVPEHAPIGTPAHRRSLQARRADYRRTAAGSPPLEPPEPRPT